MAPSLNELLAQKDALDRQIREAQSAAKVEAIAKVRQLMSEFGLTAVDLVASPKKLGAKLGAKVAPKYRDPDSGQTWTGRGLKPKWLSAALAAGKTLDEFRV